MKPVKAVDGGEQRTMGIRHALFFALVLALGAVSNAGADDNTFFSQKAGVGVTKPSKWVFAEKNDLAEGKIVVIRRHQEPYPDLNPSCHITLMPKSADKTPAQQAVEQVVRMKGDLPDFTVVEQPHEGIVSGLKGVFFKAKYSSQHEGKPYKAFWRVWYVKRPRGMVSIIMSGPQEGPEVSEEEFKAILASIKIE
jgi:hypothetical protein